MRKLLSTIALIVLVVGANGAALRAAESKPKIKAQALVERTIARYPSVVIVGVHAVAPGAKDSTMIASNIGRVGKKDDDNDNEAFLKNAPVLEAHADSGKYEVLLPLRDRTGKPIGTLAVVFPWHGEKVKQFGETAAKIRDELKADIASLDDLFTPAGEAPPLLVEGTTITIPDCKGKFDFLEVDYVNHRLLAPHETGDTMDFVDLDSNELITRAPTGASVDAVLAKNGKYFISDSDDKKVSVIDGDSLKILSEIPMPGDLDGMAYDTKNGIVYVANDEGKHIWGIDPETQKIVADVDVPGAPEVMIYDPATDRIYLNIKVTDEIVVIDPGINKIIAHWSTGAATKPHGLAFDPVTKRLFSAGGQGQLAVIDATNGKLIATVPIAPGADQAAFDPGLRRIYVATGKYLSVVQETDEGAEFLGNVTVGFPTAKDVAVDNVNRTVWTAYTDGTNAYIKSWHLPR